MKFQHETKHYFKAHPLLFLLLKVFRGITKVRR